LIRIRKCPGTLPARLSKTVPIGVQISSIASRTLTNVTAAGMEKEKHQGWDLKFAILVTD